MPMQFLASVIFSSMKNKQNNNTSWYVRTFELSNSAIEKEEKRMRYNYWAIVKGALYGVEEGGYGLLTLWNKHTYREGGFVNRLDVDDLQSGREEKNRD